MNRIRMGACVGLAALALASPAAAVTELVTNGGFETGDFTGWTAGYTPGRNVCCMGFGSTGGSRVLTTGSSLGTAIAGSYSAYGDWDGGDSTAPVDYSLDTDFWIRQQLVKTSDVTSATLTFKFNLAGGAYASYASDTAHYPTVEKRNVTANFLGADLAPQANLYTYERPLMTGQEAVTLGVQTVSIDVTSAFNTLADGSFYLDFGRNIPQYFTGGGYFVMDDVSLKVGDAVAPPPGPGVPEPSSWALMLLGFGGAGALIRRRRVQPA